MSISREDFKLYAKRIDEMEKLKKECDALKKNNRIEYIDKELRYMDLEDLTYEIKYALENILDAEERKFVYLKYIRKLSNKQLEGIFRLGRSSIYRKVDGIIKKIEFYS